MICLEPQTPVIKKISDDEDDNLDRFLRIDFMIFLNENIIKSKLRVKIVESDIQTQKIRIKEPPIHDSLTVILKSENQFSKSFSNSEG